MEKQRHHPLIAITPGEPAGIGPDVVLKAAMSPMDSAVVAIADPHLMAERSALLGLKVKITPKIGRHHRPGILPCLPISLNQSVTPGEPAPGNSPYVLESLDRAIEGCSCHQFDALVTGPVHKEGVNQSGVGFSGHTEYLAERTGSPQPVMMLLTEGVRVALLTTHLPLSEVPGKLTPERLESVLRIIDQGLRLDFAIHQPRITVCGLNPHAGEGGCLGSEETTVIEPVIRSLVREGMDLSGPCSADTAFTPDRLTKSDVILTMYHDQGLPVIKHLGFGRAVNVTLGLPIVRTSVDHGTAFDLAGTGTADEGSLIKAIEVAAQMAAHRRDK